MDATTVGCALLAAAAYYNTLDAGFVYDDRRAILGNPDVTGNETSWWRLATSDFWGTPLRLAGSHGSWRPLATLSFRANHLLGGGWHAANAALHALATALLVRAARRLAAAPALAGAAFALHPAHCEAVAALVGRADVAAAACALAALLCYARHADLRDAPVARRRCRACGTPVSNRRAPGFSLLRALHAAKTLITTALYSASHRLSCQNRSSPPSCPASDSCHKLPSSDSCRNRSSPPSCPASDFCHKLPSSDSCRNRSSPPSCPSSDSSQKLPSSDSCQNRSSPPSCSASDSRHKLPPSDSCRHRSSSPPGATRPLTSPDPWPRHTSSATVDTPANDANNNDNSSTNAHDYQPSKTPDNSPITANTPDTSYKPSHSTTRPHFLASWSSTEDQQGDGSARPDTNHNTEFFAPSRLFSTRHWRHQNGFDQPRPEEKVAKRSSLFRGKREATGRIATNMLRRRWKKCFKEKSSFADCAGDKKHLVQTAEGCSCSTAEDCSQDELHACRGSGGGGVGVGWGWLSPLFACVLLSACALLFKETGVAALAVCVAYDVALLAERGVSGPRQLLRTRRGRRALVSLAVASSSLAALVLARLAVAASVGGSGGGSVPWSAADNPASRAPRPLTRLLSLAYLPAFCWLRLLLCPATLCFDWGMAAVPLLHSPLEPRAAAAAAFYAALAAACTACLPHRIAQRAAERRRLAQQVSPGRSHRRAPTHARARCCLLAGGGAGDNSSSGASGGPRGRGALLVSLSLLVAPFLPASNLARYVGFAAAERVLYLPSAGHCLLLGLGWRRLTRGLYHHPHWKWLSGVALAATLASLGARTVVRNRDWHDEESLFRSAIHINPPKAYGNLGCVLSSAGRLEEAEWALRQALKHRPNMADVHYNLGNLLVARGRPEEAERSYRLAIHYRPSLAAAYVSLGQLLEARGRLSEASQVYEGGARLSGDRLRDPVAHLQAAVGALLRLARLRAQQRDWRAAADACRQAVDKQREANQQGLSAQAVEPLVQEALQRLETYQQMLDGSDKSSPPHSVSEAGPAGAAARRRSAGAA